MKKLFETIKAWLRSRVTAMKSEKGREKSEKVKYTRDVYENVDDNLSEMRKKKRVQLSGRNEKVSLNPQLSTLNQANRSLTLPEVQAVLCHKYELRYNLLSEQSEYRERGSEDDFLPITKRVYMT